MIRGIEIYGAGCLREAVDHLISEKKLKATSINIEERLSRKREENSLDFADIKGQRLAKRAAEIAAAGMHNLLISGPPGAGKTMIARRIPYILPPMDQEETLEVSQIHSVAGLLPPEGIVAERPFRMPHHTISPAALCGGGTVPRPGEISLAHRGVLYLDEVPEFRQETLEILRQPMEEGVVRISRSAGSCVFPADFMLVMSRNPCKCGYYPDRSRCRCSEGEVMRYLQRISRPLLDRVDLYVEARQIQYQDLTAGQREESTEEIRRRVRRAHQIQTARYEGSGFRFNSELLSTALKQYCPMSRAAELEMEQIYEKKELTARSYHRLIKVARTIADLEGSEIIEKRHLCEAVFYRPSGMPGEKRNTLRADGT